MNWLGLRLRVLLVAVACGALGGALFVRMLALGVDAPYLVGIAIGLGVAGCSRERSGMRGVLAGVISVWSVAVAQRLGGPFADVPILELASSLTWTRAALVALGIVAATGIGSRAFLRPAA